MIIDLGGVNAYLFKGQDGFLLFDTGFPGQLKKLEEALLTKGCPLNRLKLILISHGDLDHSGNCLKLREHSLAQIGMHEGDIEMVKSGDYSQNRKKVPDYCPYKFKMLLRISTLVKISPFEPFYPDLIVDEDFSLQPYGFEEKIIYTPGHSKGSISLMDANQNLYCGDLIYNFFKPEFLLIFDLKQAKSTIAKLKKLNINYVYPGHGKPFKFKDFLENFYFQKIKTLAGRYERV